MVEFGRLIGRLVRKNVEIGEVGPQEHSTSQIACTSPLISKEMLWDHESLADLHSIRRDLGSPNDATAAYNAALIILSLYRQQRAGYELRMRKRGCREVILRLP